MLILVVMLLAGCGERKSEYQIQREKEYRDVAQRLSLARKNNDIDSALNILSEENSSGYRAWDFDGFRLAVSHAFSSWVFNTMEKIEPNYSTGYYDEPSRRKTDYHSASDGISTNVKYGYFGDFAVECSWSYDTDLKMYTRNIYYTFYFRDVSFESDNWETMMDEYRALQFRVDNDKPNFYVHGEYIVYQPYSDGSSFELYYRNGLRGFEINTKNPYGNPTGELTIIAD